MSYEKNQQNQTAKLATPPLILKDIIHKNSQCITLPYYGIHLLTHLFAHSWSFLGS